MLCTHKTASSASLVLEICHQFTNSFLNRFSSIFGGNCIRKQPFKDVSVVSGEGGSLALEFDVDDGVFLGLGIFVNLHELFCDKTIVSGCVDASLHKVLVRYPNPVLVVDAVDERLSKWSVVEERLKWEVIFSSFDGCKSTLNDWENSPSAVDARCGRCQGTCSEPICCLGRCRGSLF